MQDCKLYACMASSAKMYLLAVNFCVLSFYLRHVLLFMFVSYTLILVFAFFIHRWFCLLFVHRHLRPPNIRHSSYCGTCCGNCFPSFISELCIVFINLVLSMSICSGVLFTIPYGIRILFMTGCCVHLFLVISYLFYFCLTFQPCLCLPCI